MSLSIVFMGTPDFSVPCLRALAESQHTVTAVFTQPDKPKGRGYKMIPTPVKQAAQEYDIPVYQPQSLRKGEDAQQAMQVLEQLHPDVIVVVAYGQILPKCLRHVFSRIVHGRGPQGKGKRAPAGGSARH